LGGGVWPDGLELRGTYTVVPERGVRRLAPLCRAVSAWGSVGLNLEATPKMKLSPRRGWLHLRGDDWTVSSIFPW
jgi:hypothetical protein